MTELEQLRAALADCQQQLADAAVARINIVVALRGQVAELTAKIAEPAKTKEKP